MIVPHPPSSLAVGHYRYMSGFFVLRAVCRGEGGSTLFARPHRQHGPCCSTARLLCSGCPLPRHEWISFLVDHYRLMSGNFLLFFLQRVWNRDCSVPYGLFLLAALASPCLATYQGVCPHKNATAHFTLPSSLLSRRS